MQLNLAQAWGLVVERSHVPNPQGRAVPPAFLRRCCPDMSQVLLGAGVRGWKLGGCRETYYVGVSPLQESQ